MYGTLWSFKFASGTTDCASLSAKDVGSLLNARCERMPKYCMPQTYKAIFAPEPAAIEALIHPEGRVIEDRRSRFPDAFDPQKA
jgi:hypothetical protein